MEIEIESERKNPLLHRTEVRFRVHHPGAQTPRRDEVRDLVKNKTNAGSKVVVVDELETEFGRPVTKGYAKVYDSKEQADAVESEHIRLRNKLFEKKEDA